MPRRSEDGRAAGQCRQRKNKSDTKYRKMKKSLISIRDFTKDEILHVLEVAREFEQNRVQKILEGKVIACIFFEPSTRTRLSFERPTPA